MAEPKQREDWIQAGLRALAREGVRGVLVDRLARELKITRGSFYWHFRDRADLLEAILREWEEETRWLIEESGKQAIPRDRLARFIELASGLEGRLPDAAIFMWARSDPEVARRVAATERRRVDHMVKLLEEIGLAPEAARERAEFAYLVFVGAMDRAHRDPEWRLDRAKLFARLRAWLLDGEHPG